RPPPLSTLFPYTTLFRSLSDLVCILPVCAARRIHATRYPSRQLQPPEPARCLPVLAATSGGGLHAGGRGGGVGVQRAERYAQRADRKSTRLNSSHVKISY